MCNTVTEPTVLEALRTNVAANFADLPAAAAPHVVAYEWGEHGASLAEHGYDEVVGADIVYHGGMSAPHALLLSALERASHRHTRIWLAVQHRRNTDSAAFFAAARAAGFHAASVAREANDPAASGGAAEHGDLEVFLLRRGKGGEAGS